MDHVGLVELARTQHGLLTKAQVLQHGGSDQRIRTLVAAGSWQRQRRGVFVVGAAPASWEREAMGACLAGGDGTLASLRSAARLWGLVERCGRLQLTVGDDRRVRLAGVEVHRSALLPVMDRAVAQGIPVTSFARTLADLSASQDRSTIAAWADAGLRTGDLHLLELRSCVARLAGPGRAGLTSVREVLAERMPGYDPGDSNLELRALAILAAAGLPAPVQQFRVERPGGQPAFIDLAYPRQRVGIELDGWEFHGLRGAFDRDRDRRNELTLLGWQIFNFTSTTTDRMLERVIRSALDAAAQESEVVAEQTLLTGSRCRRPDGQVSAGDQLA